MLRKVIQNGDTITAKFSTNGKSFTRARQVNGNLQLFFTVNSEEETEGTVLYTAGQEAKDVALIEDLDVTSFLPAFDSDNDTLGTPVITIESAYSLSVTVAVEYSGMITAEEV